MIKLDAIAEQLFNKIRGRFPEVTIGDEEGTITNEPALARYFDFAYTVGNNESIGKISISLDEEEGLTVIFSKDFVTEAIKDDWYRFLKELREFSKKRLMKFEVRDINRSNLTKRDYKFLAANRSGETTMAESKMYGTTKTSFQKIGNARLAIKHTAPINTESATGRSQKIKSIYIESPEGERFKYPYKHLSGARAMAVHVSEGGNAYDDFGKYISGLSEELSKLRKFNQYMSRSSVMAETLSTYTDIVKERVSTIKKEISNLQKPAYYKETFETFEPKIVEDVPTDVQDAWVEQLTIKQFNEELKDVFPYVYNLVGENTVKEIKLEDIISEGPGVTEPTGDAGQYPEVNFNPRAGQMDQPMHPQNAGLTRDNPGSENYIVQAGDTVYAISKRFGVAVEDIIEVNGLDDKGSIRVGDELVIPTVGESIMSKAFEAAVEKVLGQFGSLQEAEGCPCNTPPGGKCTCPPNCKDCNCSTNESSDLKRKPTIPLGEFILSYFDRATGQFPKGPTAVLTMVEKEYGERFVRPAHQFIERIDARVAEVMGYREAEEEIQGQVDQVYEFMGVDSKDEVDQNLMKAIQKKFGTKPVGDIRGRTYGDGDVEIDDPAVQMMLDAGILTLNPEAEKAYNAISPAKRAEIRRIIDRFQADRAQRTDNPNAQRTDNPNAQNAPGSLFDLLGDSTELDRISSLAGLK